MVPCGDHLLISIRIWGAAANLKCKSAIAIYIDELAYVFTASDGGTRPDPMLRDEERATSEHAIGLHVHHQNVWIASA